MSAGLRVYACIATNAKIRCEPAFITQGSPSKSCAAVEGDIREDDPLFLSDEFHMYCYKVGGSMFFGGRWLIIAFALCCGTCMDSFS